MISIKFITAIRPYNFSTRIRKESFFMRNNNVYTLIGNVLRGI
jgi:hypothetical protein